MTDKTNTGLIRRHYPAGMLIHWFNALTWFFLLATGLGLIDNPEFQPLGRWWPDMIRAIFGGGGNLLLAHEIVAGLWLLVWLIFLLIGLKRYTVPFLAQMLSGNPLNDAQWMIKKNLQMTMGYKMMAKMVKPLGLDGRIPDQPFYNAGQKMAALAIIGGAVALAVTGVLMASSRYALEPAQVGLVQWSITIHYIAAGLTTAMLLLHIYMAAISKEERPAFFSMFTGQVPAEYAEHHHKLWYDKIKN